MIPIQPFGHLIHPNFVILGCFGVKNDDWEQVLQAESPSDRQKRYRGDTDEKKCRNGFGVRAATRNEATPLCWNIDKQLAAQRYKTRAASDVVVSRDKAVPPHRQLPVPLSPHSRAGGT